MRMPFHLLGWLQLQCSTNLGDTSGLKVIAVKTFKFFLDFVVFDSFLSLNLTTFVDPSTSM